MRLEYKPITANNIATFNAYVNAVRCDGFSKFASYYSNELPALFKNVTFFEGEQSSSQKSSHENNASIFTEEEKKQERGKELSLTYSSLLIPQLRTVYEQVVKHREQEFAGVFVEKEIEFAELSELDRIKYSLLFNYGDKIGGYIAIASLDIQELITIFKHFVYLQNNKSESMEKIVKDIVK